MKNFFKAIFTDGEWDTDATKVFGFLLVVSGVVGFFLAIPDWMWLIGFGSTLISTGKFSKQG